MSLPVQFHFGVRRTRELRELLEDEDKITHMARSSEKFQRLQQAAQKIQISNQKLVKVNLTQKPKFRDAKLLLAVKYKELKKLRSIIQAKQDQLAEKYSVHYAYWGLLNKIRHAEEESELLFQRFTDGKTAIQDFLELFVSSQKLHHIRLVLVKKLQEIIRNETTTAQRLSEAHYLSLGLPEQPLLFCADEDELLQMGMHRRGRKPARLQPLNMQLRRHQQAPH